MTLIIFASLIVTAMVHCAKRLAADHDQLLPCDALTKAAQQAGCVAAGIDRLAKVLGYIQR